MLKIKNLFYKYPATNNWILKNVNLEIPQSSFFSLVGPSGSGKSTLLLLMRGFYQEIGGELKGEIQLFGQSISKIPIAALGKKIAIVFQNPALQLHQLRVIDEVASAPMYQGLPYQECLKRATTLLDKILGKNFYNRSPQELSAGQQQRVALAASLALDAEVLLLDEPFSFLDERADKELIELLTELHQKGKTIIVATHDIAQIAGFSTHIGLMNDGELVLSGSPKEVLYADKFSSVIPPPLFVQVAKERKFVNQFLSWNILMPKIKINKIKRQKTAHGRKKITLSLENITFSYPESKNGLKNINLDIYEGEIFGLLGENGSGKTTIAKIILGLLKPQKGKIILDGKDITRISTEARAKNIGYVTQDPLDMFFETNLWDEVAAGPRFLEMVEPKKLAEKTLKQFNLWQYKERHPDSISGGEKSRLGIADIVVNNTLILLLDEPEFGLDPKSWEEIEEFLKKLKKTGKTIIVITQDLEASFFLCDRIGIVKEGQVMKVGYPVEIFKNESLLNKAGLVPLSFSPLLKNLPTNLTLSKEEFLKIIIRNK